MKKLLTYKRIYLLILIPISLLLIGIAKSSNYFTEHVYATYIYKWISQLISTVTGVLPFSLAEVIVVLLPVVIIIILLRFFIKLFMEKQNRREKLFKGLLNVLCTGSIVLFMFTILAGMNYYRDSFGSYANLEVKDSTVEELYSLTKSLIKDANEFRTQIPLTDQNGIFKLSMSITELSKIANEAYSKLSEDYPILGGSYGVPKPIILSELMSQTEITGLFFPFTMEANVNVAVPDYTIPSTMLHELAHLRGFMKEDEANFLSYLAGMKSGNVEVRYSSTMLALITAGNALYDQDKDLYFEIRDRFSEGVIKDLRANSQYWAQYNDTVVSTVSNRINDTYLKANDQEDGVKSYGRMLDLLLAKYRKDQK